MDVKLSEYRLNRRWLSSLQVTGSVEVHHSSNGLVCRWEPSLRNRYRGYETIFCNSSTVASGIEYLFRARTNQIKSLVARRVSAR